MNRLIRLYLDMAFLRAAPQDGPGGRDIVILTSAAAVGTYVAAILGLYGPGEAIARALVDIGVLAAFLHAGLRVTGKLMRFPQAFAAFCATGAIINLAAWPILAAAGAGPESGLGVLGSIGLLAMYAWSIMVGAHIFRHSFDTSLPVGILISLGYIVISINITAVVFNAPPA